MKFNALTSVLFFVVVTCAASHGPARNIDNGHVHRARSPKFASAPDSAVLTDRAVTPADCDKGALLNKLLVVVPTSLVSAMLAEPTPFHNDNPPEFWAKLDDHEKDCLAALYPVNAEQEVAVQATEPCTTSTSTIKITQTITVTLPPTPTAALSTTSSAGGDTSSVHIPVVSTTSEARPTSSAALSKIAPYGYGNGTATHPLTPSGTGVGNTSTSLPGFTGGQSMVVANLFATTMVAAAAVALCIFV